MPLGIPHSVFLGRIVGSVDPYWLNDDQDKAVAWNNEKAEICASCGTRDADWRDEKGRVLFPAPYEVISRICAGCEQIENFKAQDKIKEKASTALSVCLIPNRSSNEDEEILNG